MYNCHICGSAVTPLLDFGRQPLANSYLAVGETDRVWYTAVWAWCDPCQLLQLVDVPDISNVFNADYPYITDQSRFMVNHFRNTANHLNYMYDLADKNVLEIGCNSGGMIEHLHQTSRVIGVEPALASQRILTRKGIPSWPSLFDQELADRIRRVSGEFDMVYCANTLRSLKDLNGFIRGVKTVLRRTGVFIFEEPYLINILDRNEFDQFYSENVYAFTISSVRGLAERYGMDLIQVDALPENHGGSLRYHLARHGYRTKTDVGEYLEAERDIVPRIQAMYAYADHIKDEFRQALIKCVRPPVGYGATAKSSTMLNWTGIGPTLIPAIYDSTPTKIGKLMPGVHIPIKDAAEFKNDSSEIVVLFPYNLAGEIIPRENAIRQRKWLVYVPEVHYD